MIKTLSKLGLGKSRLEDTILDEVEKFCHHLKEKQENPVEVVGLFNLPVLAILWKLTTGENVDYDDDTTLKKLKTFRWPLDLDLDYMSIDEYYY